MQNKKILGCLCRGTDYLYRRPKEHPVQPDPEEVIIKCTDILKERNCDLIFLATEDEEIYNKFKKHFGDSLITNNHEFFHDTGTTLLSDVKQGRDNEKFLRGMEYLVTIYLLSECDCLVAGRTNGSAAVLMLSDGYEYVYIYDLGYYE